MLFSRRPLATLCLVALCVLCPATHAQSIDVPDSPGLGRIHPVGPDLYVDDDAPAGGDGLSWETAYRFLQDALAGAGPMTEIRVAQGTYKPDEDEAGNVAPGDRHATFQLINDVTLTGGYAGVGAPDPDQRDIDLFETILSGDLNGDDGPDFVKNTKNAENSFHVVTGSGTDQTAVLDGFTVTAGNANGGFLNNVGGGMFNSVGSPTVTDCTFSGNTTSGFGGAMFNFIDSSPTVTNCTFSGNMAGHFGAGMINKNNSSPTVTNCTFTENDADLIGGGMRNIDSSPTVTNCIFWANSDSGGMDESAQIHIDGSGMTEVNYSVVQGGWTGLGGTGNISADPLFADADGRLSLGSPAIDAGDNTAPGLAGITTDVEGKPRFLDDPNALDTGNGTSPIVDMGAYERDPFPGRPRRHGGRSRLHR